MSASGAAVPTDAAPAAGEVSGSWNVTTEVEPSAAGNDVALAFQLTLEQRGNRVVARLKVRDVEQSMSVADLVPGTLRTGDSIRSGDLVVAAKMPAPPPTPEPAPGSE